MESVVAFFTFMLTSKTFWLNAVGVLLTILTSNDVVLPQEWTPYVPQVIFVLNLINRFLLPSTAVTTNP